jgi:3-oxocholest-4-en-26-oate---CoA ligase
VTRSLTFNLADLFETLADAGPDRLALVAPPARLTFGQLDDRATRLANHLRDAMGVGIGDHVAIHARNRAEWIESMLACFKLRAVPINVNYRYVEAELRYLYDNADCVAIITEPDYVAVVDAVRATMPSIRSVLVMGDEYETAIAEASPVRNFGPRSNDDLYILYTGGTTGMPKGVMWRHEDAFHAVAGGGKLGNGAIERPEDIAANALAGQAKLMATTPIMHGGAQWMFFFACYSGGCSVIWTGKSFDPVAVLQLASDEKVHSLQIIGDAMGRPLAQAMQGSTLDLSNLFSIGSGGAPLTAAVKGELMKALPHATVRDSYGASETGSAGGAAPSSEGPAKFTMTPQCTVLDESLRPVVAGSGEIGKLARRGHIPLGYYKDPAKTAETFPTDSDGMRWVVPGDFATLEDDGTIVILGRGSVSINSGGEKIFPEEVEAALRHHPSVYDAVVCGLPDERWGQRTVALVQLRPGTSVTLAELVAHSRTLIADYKAPKQVFFVEEVAHTPVGKPDYVWAKDTATRLAADVV